MSVAANHYATDSMLEDVILSFGYIPEDDSWDIDGRRTYIHEDDATRKFQTKLENALVFYGWKRSPHALRTFYHPKSRKIIEIEPGGSGLTGHFLHYMKAELADDCI